MIDVVHSGNLINIVTEMGRPDAAAALVAGCPFYRITSLDEAEEMQARQREAAAASVSR